MKNILVLRISRRAIGAAVLHDQQLMFFDGRHLSSDRARALETSSRYLQRLLGLTEPAHVVLETALHDGSQTTAVVEAIRTVLNERKIPLRQVAVEDVLQAFAVPALRSRRQLRERAPGLLPQLVDLQGDVKPYIVDAAATALFVESATALGVLPAP